MWFDYEVCKLKHTIHVKECRICGKPAHKNSDHIPKFNKTIADKYVASAGNIFSRFEQLERNKLWLQKIRTNGIDNGILLFDNHKKQERLEKQHKLLVEFSTPTINGRKEKVWNLGGGVNPFLAMYVHTHKYEIKKPTWRVRKCLQ